MCRQTTSTSVAAAICKDMRSKGLADEELAGIKADIKAAFMQVPIHLCVIVTLCMSFEGWTFVFVRTPFGWKWATHTFSVFTDGSTEVQALKFLSKWLASHGSAGSMEAHGTQVQCSQWCKAIAD